MHLKLSIVSVKFYVKNIVDADSLQNIKKC